MIFLRAGMLSVHAPIGPGITWCLFAHDVNVMHASNTLDRRDAGFASHHMFRSD